MCAEQGITNKKPKLITCISVFVNDVKKIFNAKRKKKYFRSFPYKNIQSFSVETAGTFDMDAELKIWVSHSKDPIELEIATPLDYEPWIDLTSQTWS